MKFAVACDSSSVNSYYSKNNKVFTFDNLPYYRDHHISNECLMGFWNYPVLFDGYFINLREDIYPDENFDIIFCAIEKNIHYLNILSKLYPKAKLVGTIKEMVIHNKEIREQLILYTDFFIVPYLSFDYFKMFDYTTPKIIYKIPQPINIDYLQKYYSADKQNIIFNYENYWASGRSGLNKDFINKLNYNIYKFTASSWSKFIDEWKHCKFMLNLDKTLNVGQQAIQCATLGTIMLGGNNDSHKILYPKLATTNINNLMLEFNKLIHDIDYYKFTIKYALKRVNELYSFESVSKKIRNILK